MASVAAMPTRALRPATAFARSSDVDAGRCRSCRGGTSDRAAMFARFSNVDCESLGSRRALATGIDRDGLASRSTPRGMTVVPRAAPRDSADDPSAAPPSHAPHASSPRELWELSGRSSGSSGPDARDARRRRRRVPFLPPMSPTRAAARGSPRRRGVRRGLPARGVPARGARAPAPVPRRADPPAFEDGGVRRISRREISRPRVPRGGLRGRPFDVRAGRRV